MEPNSTDTGILVDDVSRPFKRRKFYRKRADSPSDEAGSTASPIIHASIPLPDIVADPLAQALKLSDVEQDMSGENSHFTVAEILRRRKAQRRRGGIGFTNIATITESGVDGPRPGGDVLENEDNFGKILSVVDRFAPQTGQVADVDKHMYAAPKSFHNPRVMQMITV